MGFPDSINSMLNFQGCTVDASEIPFPTTRLDGASKPYKSWGYSTTNLPPSTGELSLSDFLVSLGGPSRFSRVGPSGAVGPEDGDVFDWTNPTFGVEKVTAWLNHLAPEISRNEIWDFFL